MFSFGDRSFKEPASMQESAVQDDLLKDFLLCDDADLSGKTDLVFIHREGYFQSPGLGSVPIPTIRRDFSDLQMHNDENDDLSLHPCDIDSQILDQAPELSDDDDAATPPTPCHTMESFASIGALMAQLPTLEVFENEHDVETTPNNDDSPVKPASQILAVLVQFFRRSLSAIFVSIQFTLRALILLCWLAKTALVSLWWAAKAALLLLFAAKVLLVNVVKTTRFAIATPRRCQLMLVMIVGILGMMGYVKLGSRYHALPSRSNIAILNYDHNDIVISAPFIENVQSHLSSFVVSAMATLHSLLSATDDKIIEPVVILEQLTTRQSYGTPVERIFNVLCSTACVVLSCLALTAYVRSFFNIPEETQPTKRAGPKKTLKSVDFTTPAKMSNLPEVETQLHVLGCNKSGDYRANIQQLVKARKELFDDMKRDDLRIILKEHGMSPSGLKKDLSKRLAEQWSIVPLPLPKPDMAKSLIATRRQLFGECKTQDLQRLLKEHCMSPSGNKTALAQRLAESYGTIGLPATC
jgi:hypothetical protein